MAKKNYYYGYNYNEVDQETTEVVVEINSASGGKYRAEFSGPYGPVKAIEYATAIKNLLGKDNVVRFMVDTRLYTPDIIEAAE